MKLIDKTCIEFTEALSSKAAIPGGGGASALAGALGMALGAMVCNLTIGKKKYAEHEDEIKGILKRALEIQEDFLSMVDEDAENFLPLSKAYGLPSSTEEEKRTKERTLEESLKLACKTPIQIIETSYEAIKLHEKLVDKGSSLAISDIAVGIQFLRTTLLGGQINVMININMINDQIYVADVKLKTETLVKEGVEIADRVYEKIQDILS